MAFGWNLIDLEISTTLDLDIGKRTRQHFAELQHPVVPLHAVFAGQAGQASKQTFDLQLSFAILEAFA